MNTMHNLRKIRKKLRRASVANLMLAWRDTIHVDGETSLITFTFVKNVTDGSTIFPLWPDSLAISNKKPEPLTAELINNCSQHLEQC